MLRLHEQSNPYCRYGTPCAYDTRTHKTCHRVAVVRKTGMDLRKFET
jgi:hypothetical protein